MLRHLLDRVGHYVVLLAGGNEARPSLTLDHQNGGVVGRQAVVVYDCLARQVENLYFLLLLFRNNRDKERIVTVVPELIPLRLRYVRDEGTINLSLRLIPLKEVLEEAHPPVNHVHRNVPIRLR